MTPILPIHSGAIEKGGIAFLFIAPTGSGKTTLVAYLSELGYPYINDDHISIDTRTLLVQPNIAPVHLRLDSIPILRKYGFDIKGTELHTENIHRIVYTPKAISTGELPIGGIFFITRSDSENRCETIPKSEAVQLLMQNLMNSSAVNGESLKCAIKLAAKCRRLIYSDMRYVAEIIESEA